MKTECLCSRTLIALILITACGSGCRQPTVDNATRPPPASRSTRDSSALEILQRYAEAWRGSEEMVLQEELVVNFKIAGAGGGEYHVVVAPGGNAQVFEGKAENCSMGFETDIDFLRRLDRNEVNALTAMAQASGDDPIPLRPILPDGFEWTPENRSTIIPFWFHFWNREWPETIRFGEGTTRPVHGALAAVFYYDKGIRASWYQLKPGMHINADPRDQTNPFHSLLMVTRGTLESRLGGQPRRLLEGEAVFIPSGMSHEFWAEEGQYGEMILIMFGEGA